MLKPGDTDLEKTLSRGIILTVTLVAASLLILNVVLISFYVRRRSRKDRGGGGPPNSINGNCPFSIFLTFPIFVFRGDQPSLPNRARATVGGSRVSLCVCHSLDPIERRVAVVLRAVQEEASQEQGRQRLLCL